MTGTGVTGLDWARAMHRRRWFGSTVLTYSNKIYIILLYYNHGL